MGCEPPSDQPEAKKFDLTERTAIFGEQVIRLARKVKVDVTSPLIKQMVRSGTSVGANYDEADEAASKREFRYRIAVCKKEAKETKRWIRMIVVAAPAIREEARPVWQEAHELHLSFCSIHRRSQDDGEGI